MFVIHLMINIFLSSLKVELDSSELINADSRYSRPKTYPKYLSVRFTRLSRTRHESLNIVLKLIKCIGGRVRHKKSLQGIFFFIL